MDDASTHLEVPTDTGAVASCLGPGGSADQVRQTLSLISGRWKLPILFRLFATPSLRYLALLREINGITPKMLTQHLRQLEADGLVTRTDFDEKPRRVEYALSPDGTALRPILIGLRDFARNRF